MCENNCCEEGNICWKIDDDYSVCIPEEVTPIKNYNRSASNECATNTIDDEGRINIFQSRCGGGTRWEGAGSCCNDNEKCHWISDKRAICLPNL